MYPITEDAVMSRKSCAPAAASFGPPNAATFNSGRFAKTPCNIRAACSSPECSPAMIRRSTRPPIGGGRERGTSADIEMDSEFLATEGTELRHRVHRENPNRSEIERPEQPQKCTPVFWPPAASVSELCVLCGDMPLPL